MTNKEFSLMRLRLEQESRNLTSRLESLRADIMTGNETARNSIAEMEEQAAEASSLENLLAQEQRIVDDLAEVDAALKKFRAGTYGLCEKCGCPISASRLQAMPAATLCIEDARGLRHAKPCARPEADTLVV